MRSSAQKHAPRAAVRGLVTACALAFASLAHADVPPNQSCLALVGAPHFGNLLDQSPLGQPFNAYLPLALDGIQAQSLVVEPAGYVDYERFGIDESDGQSSLNAVLAADAQGHFAVHLQSYRDVDDPIYPMLLKLHWNNVRDPGQDTCYLAVTALPDAPMHPEVGQVVSFEDNPLGHRPSAYPKYHPVGAAASTQECAHPHHGAGTVHRAHVVHTVPRVRHAYRHHHYPHHARTLAWHPHTHARHALGAHPGLLAHHASSHPLMPVVNPSHPSSAPAPVVAPAHVAPVHAAPVVSAVPVPVVQPTPHAPSSAPAAASSAKVPVVAPAKVVASAAASAPVAASAPSAHASRAAAASAPHAQASAASAPVAKAKTKPVHHVSPKTVAAAPAHVSHAAPGGLLAILGWKRLVAILGALLLGVFAVRWERSMRAKRLEAKRVWTPEIQPAKEPAAEAAHSADVTSSRKNSSIPPSTAAPSSIFTQFQPSRVLEEEIDPIVEARTYMEHKRLDRAADIIKTYLDDGHDDLAARTTYAEVLARMGNVDAFDEQAWMVYERTNGVGADWAKICRLGVKINPGNVLYQSASGDD